MKNLKKYFHANRMIVGGLIFLVTFMPGCGKEEATGGAVGAASGAALGAAVTNKKHTGTGILLGAAMGNLIGRTVGAQEDRKKERAEHHAEVRALEEENKDLQKALDKWCGRCTRKVAIRDAHTCPSCGDELITQKICPRCTMTFAPNSGYRFCPYCRGHVMLTRR